MPGRTILIADDDAGVRFTVSAYLTHRGFTVQLASSCREVEDAVRRQAPDALVLDYYLVDGDAASLLPQLRAVEPSMPIVVFSGAESIDAAVSAIKGGAIEYLVKPVPLGTLVDILEEQLRRRVPFGLAASGAGSGQIDPFAGSSAAVRRLAEDARRVLDSDRPILIQGETGTGKGTLARWLHRNGPRGDEPFLSINCASLSHTLLESELFGHERGAFTGATTSKQGLLEAAHRGVLLLDELGDMDLAIQPKLLTVLEDQRFLRLGSVQERNVDIRLIAATHQDLKQLAKEGRFRSDLYYRVSTLPLMVPTLRERPEDIPVLAANLVRELGTEISRPELRLSRQADEELQQQMWPGNIRELRNVIERAAYFSDHDELTPADLRIDQSQSLVLESPAGDPKATLAEIERNHIRTVLDRCDGNVARAAEALGIPRSTLYTKLRKLTPA